MTTQSPLPVVSVIGRPNVGKSTLFNRILGRREAIVEERPGVTRDRKALEAEWLGHSFLLVDTGGWMPTGSDLDGKVSAQSERAIDTSDLIVMVVDGATGITEEDTRVAWILRRSGVRVILAVNKIDSPLRDQDIWEFMSLGLGDPLGVSALHSRNTGDLLDRIVQMLPASEAPIGEELLSTSEATVDEEVLGVAIVGRPNVGKSTLFNRLIGDERSVVHDMPGTTRDAIDTVVETELGPLRFIDTAGMRRKSRVDDDTEYYSTLRALRAIDKADVALLVIDASEGVTSQDQRLAERVDAAGCPIVILMNKWEVVTQEEKDELMYQLGQRLHFLGESPVLRISALTGRGIQRLVPALEAAIDAYETRVPTRRVNEVIQLAQSAQPAPHGGRVLYATQGATHPPTFTLFTNKELPASYVRYLERRLREEFDLGATPIKMRLRRRG
ncbi:MAG: ribosome biogenesis GTPase Der [Actinomycetota bacterium]|jgi:GTP-binding protein|nr:ribosome biogenesis GTPase Der [Acidimicrobiales bacterium]MEC8924090.1 ribosome biogenesis GTPase Der [Actinomycetota bacterium]MEE2680215.1 ribosome biogenesis GTPase Der [Actinomycetota bacterium]